MFRFHGSHTEKDSLVFPLMFGWEMLLLDQDDAECNIKWLPLYQISLCTAISTCYLLQCELHYHAIYICKLPVQSCLCNASRCQMICCSHPEGERGNQHPEEKKKGEKEQKSKLEGEIAGSCRQRSCCAEDGVV